ncbi:MAG: hypothetical protein KDE54_06655, partial [Caldilineaceae bacterium]|nr:hypothetical protein [Caldilineaceae bacterium]
VSAQVRNDAGVWGEMLPRANGALERFPPSSWPAGQFVRNELDINLNPQTPAGEYAVVVGAVDASAGHVLEQVDCGVVQVTD